MMLCWHASENNNAPSEHMEMPSTTKAFTSVSGNFISEHNA
jgi:hypothetical protein